MPDLLVRLYDLPPEEPPPPAVRLRAAMACEKLKVVNWVRAVFGDGWAGECDIAFSRQPISCFIALAGSEIVGFACWECTARGFAGPIGVAENFRKKGIGRALLLKSLWAMAELGYAYAIIGGAGSPGFYSKAVDFMEIPGSTPGIYQK